MEEINKKTFDKVLTEEEQKALNIKETILKIFEKNMIYSDSEVFTKTIEYDGEDKEGNESYEDIEFMIEDGLLYDEYEQIVKYDLLEDIWNKAQKEGEIKGLLYARESIVAFDGVPADFKVDLRLKELECKIEK